MEKRSNLHLFVALLSIFLVWSCDNTLKNKSAFSPEAIVTARQGGPGTNVESAGNNLSFPVIWSDGVVKLLRGTYGQTQFDGDFFTVGGVDWYVQNDASNVWQAENINAISDNLGKIAVSTIDWGDNLEARSWPFGSQVRVEIVLYHKLTPPRTMTGYTMLQNLGLQAGLAVALQRPDQTGTTEVWGTNKETYPVDSATVYSGNARLVIQKLNKNRDDATLATTWDVATSQWTGDVGVPLFSGAVWNDSDGPAGFSAEVNVQGKVLYGYNWVTRTTADGPGDYRITFVLDTNSPLENYNTYFDENTAIMPNTTEVIVPAAEDGSDLEGGTAVVRPDLNLSYIDVRLSLKNGNNKPGNTGKGNGGSGGKGNHGGQNTPASN